MRPRSAEAINRAVEERVEEIVADFAQENYFIQLTSPTLPLPFGATYSNPNYLRSCNLTYSRPTSVPFNSHFYAEFFVHEFRCLDSYADNSDRIEKAALSAQDLFKEVLQTYRPDYADHTRILPAMELTRRVEEQAADRYGMEIYLEAMRASREDEADPMLHFMVNYSGLCAAEDPYQEAFPAESNLMQRLGKNQHSSSEKRLHEILTPEIRNHLGCRLSQPVDDCRPF